jgi:hypothetical protein
MIELIFAKMVDNGTDLSFYPSSLMAFFNYLATTSLSELIFFCDYHAKADICIDATKPVRIVDPVNCGNNVARLYSTQQAKLIAAAASEAGDAIEWATQASGKGETVEAWQSIFGPSFTV